MNALKNLPGRVLLALLAALMALGAGASLWAAGTRPDPVWQGFWGGVSTTCLGVFATVFLVDRLLRRVEERRRSGLTRHVRQRVSRLAFHETERVAALVLGRPEGAARPGSARDGEGVNRMPDGFAARVDEAMAATGRWVAQLDPGGWQSLGRSFARTAGEYSRLIALFGHEMDAEILTLMLRGEESAHRVAGIVADRPGALGGDGGAPGGAHCVAGDETADVVAFHVKRIMRVNAEILRTV